MLEVVQLVGLVPWAIGMALEVDGAVIAGAILNLLICIIRVIVLINESKQTYKKEDQPQQ